jgi:hypothetical protein
MKDNVAVYVGIGIIVGFAALVVFMLIGSSQSELDWSRKVYIFGSVEAIAFTAAGYFFGKEVHRERAENAEKSAEKNREKADAADKQRAEAEHREAEAKSRETEARANGNALAAAVTSKADVHREAGKPDISSEAAGARTLNESKGFAAHVERAPARATTQGDLDELASLALKLFPQG